MTDEEWIKNIKNISDQELIEELDNCGHDGYYNDLYYSVVDEIKRRLGMEKKMKAILVFDDNYIPPNHDRPICDSCPLRNENEFCNYLFQDVSEYIHGVGKERPENCPLKPLPEKLAENSWEDDNSQGIARGWNAFREEITGETE